MKKTFGKHFAITPCIVYIFYHNRAAAVKLQNLRARWRGENIIFVLEFYKKIIVRNRTIHHKQLQDTHTNHNLLNTVHCYRYYSIVPVK